MIIQTIPAIRKANLGPDIGTKVQTKVEGYSDVEEEDETKTKASETKTEESKTQKEATIDVSLRWNRDGEYSLCGGYEKRSKSSFQRHQKLA